MDTKTRGKSRFPSLEDALRFAASRLAHRPGDSLIFYGPDGQIIAVVRARHGRAVLARRVARKPPVAYRMADRDEAMAMARRMMAIHDETFRRLAD